MTARELPQVRLGDRTYLLERGWGRLPEGLAYTLVSQVAVDSAGRVHVFQRGTPPVLWFEPDGSFGGHHGTDVVHDAHGIYCSPDDRLFLVDRDAHQIIVTDPAGRELSRLGERHRPRQGAPFNHPTDACVAGDGEIYVSDGYGNAQVHRFSAEGRHLMSWGSLGSGPGQFITPHAIWVDRRDRVLVADRENDRVQLFSRDGRHLADWRGLFHPMDIWEDADGLIYVTDQVPSLSLFAPSGERLGRCRPALNGAHGIFGAADGTIYLAEMNPSCITRLVPRPGA